MEIVSRWSEILDKLNAHFADNEYSNQQKQIQKILYLH